MSAPYTTGPNSQLSHVEPDDIGVGMMTVLGALVFVGITLIVVLLQAWFYNWKDEILAQRMGAVDEQATPAAIARTQREQIENYGWADAKKHLRAIPIQRAMELIVAENSSAGADSTGPANSTGTGPAAAEQKASEPK